MILRESTKDEERRFGAALASNGWEKCRVMENGKKFRKWRTKVDHLTDHVDGPP